MSLPEKIENTNEDLGLGGRVAEENRTRFLNPDGSFNVHRKGILERGFFSPYHAILNASWPGFYVRIIAIYLGGNVIFGLLYFLSGSNAFAPLAAKGPFARFLDFFYYSIQITTLGKTSFEPVTFVAKFLVSTEGIIGLLAFAFAAALMMARFSNPATLIDFSERAVLAPYRGITGFMTRIVNRRNNELIEVKAAVTLALENDHGKREFHQLPLERSGVLVFPLSWTIVHPIDKKSPLYGLTADDLRRRKVEIVVAISGVDQDLSKTVYARRSYVAEEIATGSRFRNILERTTEGTIVIDPARIHEIEPAS